MGSVLRLVTCGSVDDGKSTLIGRLLADTGGVPLDQLDQARRTRRGGSAVPPGEIDYSLLTDGLEAEREQGITIDVAYRFLDLPENHRVIIADAPGHDRHGANMAVAASTADVAVLLIDAEHGVRPAACRHLAVCTTMGVRSVIVALNKLDAVGYDQSAFDRVAADIRTVAANLGTEELHVVPVSALRGDNITTPSPNLPWYDGPTFLGLLAEWRPETAARATTARLPVQYVIRADRFRGLAGTVTGGVLRTGDSVAITGTGEVATVARLLGPAGELDHATAGTPVSVVLNGDTPSPATALTATVVWTGADPLEVGTDYLLLAGPNPPPPR
jgi:bifunctional enzyme CysN/CysC